MAGGSLNAQYAPLYVAAGKKYGIPASVLAGVADVETNGGANISVSSAGAQGLMQFMPSTAAGLGVNPADPRSAIFGAAKLLVQYGYHSDPMRALGAYNGGPGNPQYSYASLVMSNAKRLAGDLSKYGAAGSIAQGKATGKPKGGGKGPTSTGAQTSTSTVTSGRQPDYGAAGIQALLSGASKPIDTSGRVTPDNTLGRLMANVASGQYTTPVSTSTVKTIAQGKAVGKAPKGGAAVPSGPVGQYGGYVNPTRGAIVGRTDMGLDVSGLPNGHPIVAIGNSKVVSISPNWYAGQPYVLFQFLDGPKKGQYYYISEAINPTVRPGQVVKAGQQVGTYNSSGTGLEMGFGSSAGGRTLAQATTGYSEGQVTTAGSQFAGFYKGLK